MTGILKRTALPVFLAAVAMVVVPVAAEADGDGRADLRGVWRGTLVGADPAIRVHVRLGTVNRIRFRGGLDCSGVLEYLGRRGAAFRYRERITASESANCVGLGIVLLTPRADGALRYQWRSGDNRARAVLRRP